jgi:2-dehydropantoate 2-reductase
MQTNIIKNIWVFGVGGVGGYFGGKIAYFLQNKTDERRVFFIARGKHLEEIRKSGLILNTPEKKGIICKPAMATEDVREIPSPDLCFICVKAYDLNNTVNELKGVLKEDTIIIPLLNGVDIYERIRSITNMGIVLPACVYVGTHIEKPGVVTQNGGDGVILLGNDPEKARFNPEPVINLFNETGIKHIWNENPYTAIWEKYIFISAFGLVTAFSGKTIGEVLSNQNLKGLTEDIIREVVLIARKKDIELSNEIIEKTMEKGKHFPFNTKTSYQRDVETSGKKNEGDLFGRTILSMGKELGVSTPKTEEVYSAIQQGIV